MISIFKGKYPIGNSLSVFNHYKRMTGRSLERDLSSLQRLNDVNENPNATAEEINKAYAVSEADAFEITQYLYYAMRCSGEKRELDFLEVLDELDVSDIANGEIEKLIAFLTIGKKKETQGMLSFLPRKKKRI